MLGVLGGMGPMATADFMAKIVRATPATCDQDHIDVVACSAASIPDRVGPIFGRGADPFPAMRRALARLEAAGATCIAIALEKFTDVRLEAPLGDRKVVDGAK